MQLWDGQIIEEKIHTKKNARYAEFTHTCCDCELKHKVKVNVEDEKLCFAYWRLESESATDPTQLPSNVYSRWKKFIGRAEEEIVIFTPYLDFTLIDLFKWAKIPSKNISLVTQFSADYLIEHPAQLRTLKQLSENGVNLLHLELLHAKILMIDEKRIVFGSQNFTRQGKRNKEMSGACEGFRLENHVPQTLKEWMGMATPIDPDLIDALLDSLASLIKEHKKLVKKAIKVEAETRVALEEEKKKRDSELVDQIIDLSTLQLRKAYMPAYVTSIWDEWGNDYDTLKCSAGESLIRWFRKDENGEWNSHTYSRLQEYPALISPSMRMAFIRVGITRITYFRGGVAWNKPYFLNGELFDVSVKLPKKDALRRNMIFTLSHGATKKWDIEAFFDGRSITPVNLLSNKAGRDDRLYSVVKSELFDNRENLMDFFESFLSCFKYDQVLGEKNVRTYLPFHAYQISLAEIGTTPFYILKEWY